MHVSERVATALWHPTAALLLALDEQLGAPVDSYVNGSQTWLTPDGPGEIMVEWRLHPVGNYVAPRGLSHYDVWETVIAALSRNAEVIGLGEEHRTIEQLWGGLESFAAYGDDPEGPTLGVKVGFDRQDELLEDSRFFPTPYAARQGWVSIRLGSKTNWSEIAGLLREAYRQVALKRMLAALEK